jgi:hypothetical protein
MTDPEVTTPMTPPPAVEPDTAFGPISPTTADGADSETDAPASAAPTGPVTAAPAAETTTLTTGTAEFVTCPECGTTATVNLRRRESADFCRNCDFPLFWTPSQVLLGHADLADDSLRRLPGTTGRAMTASAACPHCAEPNPVMAETCVRCGRSMHVRAEAPPPPPPPPVYVQPPAPVYVEPKKRIPWWVWLVAGLLISTVVVLAILWANGTFG